MACIGGILMFVAFNMVKPAEVKQVLGPQPVPRRR